MITALPPAVARLTAVRAFALLRGQRRRRARDGAEGASAKAEKRMARHISAVLRTGVVLSAALVALGAASFSWLELASVPRYDVFRGEPEALCRAAGIVQAALAGSGRGVIQLGVLVLLATPVARVALSLLTFVLIGDRTYMIVAAAVLFMLALGLAGESTWFQGS